MDDMYFVKLKKPHEGTFQFACKDVDDARHVAATLANNIFDNTEIHIVRIITEKFP